MKRIASLLLLTVVLFSLFGCRSQHAQPLSGADFYYLRADIIYGAEDGVIAGERYQGQLDSLADVLEAYLHGPRTEGLCYPFPADTEIISFQLSGSTLTLRLSDHVSALSALDQTLAYACLAKTCFAYGGITEIRVQYEGNDSITVLTPDNLIFRDSGDTIHATIGTEPILP